VGSIVASVAPTQPVGDQDHTAISKRERGELGVVAHRKGAIGDGLALARRHSDERGTGPAPPRALSGCGASSRPSHGDGEIVRWAITEEPWRRDRGLTVGGLPETETGRQGLGHEVGVLLK
jgi:hypothetical protein